MWASKRGHADIVTMLIQAGANVNYQDRQVMLLCTAFACTKTVRGFNLASFLQRCWEFTIFICWLSSHRNNYTAHSNVYCGNAY
jgi:hypothetical protein